MSVTEPLCGKEWLDAHVFTCKRCGRCCLTVPCLWGQLFYGLTEEHPKCPALVEENGMLTCTAMKQNKQMRKAMLGKGCDYVDYLVSEKE